MKANVVNKYLQHMDLDDFWKMTDWKNRMGSHNYDVHGLELEEQDSTVSKPRWRKTASTAEENMLLMWRFE